MPFTSFTSDVLFKQALVDAEDALVLVEFEFPLYRPEMEKDSFRRVSDRWSQAALFFQVDAYNCRETINALNIPAYPAYIFYRNGRPVCKIATPTWQQLESELYPLMQDFDRVRVERYKNKVQPEIRRSSRLKRKPSRYD
ncbi:hypothetical protein HDE_09796 [Halotydeus destructor]|nr:hypothetical protein HDE_09796 [Halotydeus destructor]